MASKLFLPLSRRVMAIVIVLAMLSLAAPGAVAFADEGTVDADQAALEDGTVARTNPFPELITDEEAQKYFAKEYLSLFDAEYALERNGELLKISGSSLIVQPGDVLRLAVVMNATQKTGMTKIGNLFGFFGFQFDHKVGADGVSRLDYDFSKGKPIFLTPEVFLNGKPWKRYENGGMWTPAPGYTHWMKLKSDFLWPSISHFQYVEYRLKIPAGMVLLQKKFWGTASQKNHVYGGGTYLPFFVDYLGSAQFTPVDDFAYREAAGLEVTPESPVELPARSAGKPAFDDTAFHPLAQLQALGDPKVARGTLMDNFPMLRDVKHPIADKDLLQYAKQSNNSKGILPPRTWADNTEDRPSLEDLTGREIPGYVYVSNDIDKSAPIENFASSPKTPKDGDNGRISYAIDHKGKFPSAGKLPQDRPATEDDLTGEDYLTDKYYYVTYRQIPAPVKVLKVDEQGKVLPGACFTLNKLVNKKPVELVKDLCASEDGVVLPAAELNTEQIKDFVKHNNPLDATHSLYKTKQGGYLLAPGEYSLVETTVPKGYEKGEDAKFTVKLQTEVEVKPVEVKVVNSLQPSTPPAPSVPPAPGEPVVPNEPVVSTPTPTPTPTPAPTPTPTPTPAPSGPGLSSTGVSPVAGLVAFGLLLVGGGFVGLASRRRL